MKKLILVLSVLALFVLVGCVPTEPQTQEELEAQMDSGSGAIAGQAVAGSDGGAFPAGCTGTTVYSCRRDDAIGRTYYKTYVGSTEAIAMDRCPTSTTAAQFSCQGNVLLKCTTSCPTGCERTATGVQCVVPAPVAANFCGDGVVAGGEQCDDGNRIDLDGCSLTCTVVRQLPATCGDNITQYVLGVEECDSGRLTTGELVNDRWCNNCIRRPGCINAGQNVKQVINSTTVVYTLCPGDGNNAVIGGNVTGKSVTGTCRTDNTTYSGCMTLAIHLSQCAAAKTCKY